MTPEPKLNHNDYLVQAVPLKVCQDLVKQYHYAKGGSNTGVYTHGLIERSTGNTVGCAWWIPPTKSAALATYPQNWQRVLTLSRLVILPGVPKNAASFLVGRSIRLIIKGGKWSCLVTYADTYQNHTGAIYKATNWKSVGLTKPERLYVNAVGQMIARKAGPKTRTHQEMLDLGYTCLGAFPKHKFVLELV